MKRIFTLLLLIGCFLMSFNSDGFFGDEKMVNKFLTRNAKKLQHKYGMNPIGTNVAMPGGVLKVLGLDFQIQKPLTREEARILLINISKEFLTAINENKKILSLFKESPTISSIGITLFILDTHGDELYDPNLGIVAISEGKLEYITLVKKQNQEIKDKYIESYEEALLLTQQSNQNQ